MTNITESVETTLTRLTQTFNTRMEKLETAQKELSSSMNITASFKDDVEQEINIMRNESKQSKEDMKQYQSMTDRRLHVLENKPSNYDAINITKLNKTLTDTRNTVLYYHPEVKLITKADGSYHAGIKIVNSI